jgi:hypothetical protein
MNARLVLLALLSLAVVVVAVVGPDASAFPDTMEQGSADMGLRDQNLAIPGAVDADDTPLSAAARHVSGDSAGALGAPDRGQQVGGASLGPVADYVRFEGSHIVVELFPEHAGLLKNPERWVEQLDAVYEAFADLVGGVPYEGQKITIQEAPPMPYIALSGNPIQWNTDYVPSGIKTLNDGGLGTGMFHELSHDFDLAGWAYVTQLPAADAEHWANFKELYALHRLAPLYPEAWYGSEPVPLSKFGEAYFVESLAEPYLSAGSGDWRTMPHDVFTGLFYLEAQEIGWGPFKEAFRDYLAGRFDQGAVTTDEGKINEFLRLLSKHAGQDLSPQFREWGFPTPPLTLASLSQGWNQPCYVGPEQPVEQALADIVADVQAVYRLGAGQTFDRWFAGRPDVSNITTIRPYEPLLVLMGKDAAWSQTPSGSPPSSVSLAPGWNSVCYAGQSKSADDATTGMANAFSILYRLGSDQTWGRFLPARPELSSITQLSQYDSVLVLMTQEGGATWTFDP